MRKVNYKVRQANGVEFCTTNYTEAKNNGNIIETYFTPVEERTEKEKTIIKTHAYKIWHKKGKGE